MRVDRMTNVGHGIDGFRPAPIECLVELMLDRRTLHLRKSCVVNAQVNTDVIRPTQLEQWVVSHGVV